ncbi:type II secretion system F family protein [Gulosibacter sp. ACHW.36C]|uniref:Type II secretion system F family protein n=1 Tax=Gulosibacter sediminis TaxID=1729695 RepID=A0ABY4N2K2_9MICO|nr:type II secretion system F family protein [Gulosibacter sediminis]UQN15866.1 type II secretion system F family protein [Gulosibacter sediminis]
MISSQPLALALLLGTVLGLGLWSVVATLPQLRRPRLIDRVAPHLVDIAPAAREHARRRVIDPLPILGQLLSPLIGWLRRVLGEVIGGNELVSTRLRQAGQVVSVERFRTQQAVWALVGVVLGLVFALASFRSAANQVLVFALMPLLGGVIAVGARELLLRHAASSRIRRIASEYPTVLEFLSLSLAAGEGIFDSLVRVSSLGNSELGREFAGVVRRVRAGAALGPSLRELGRDLGYVPLARTCDHLLTAMERGAPLVEVLQAQASDARDLSKRELLEVAGRNELRMMVPLVMLILPVTVLFALYPSFFIISTSF